MQIFGSQNPAEWNNDPQPWLVTRYGIERGRFATYDIARTADGDPEGRIVADKPRDEFTPELAHQYNVILEEFRVAYRKDPSVKTVTAWLAGVVDQWQEWQTFVKPKMEYIPAGLSALRADPEDVARAYWDVDEALGGYTELRGAAISLVGDTAGSSNWSNSVAAELQQMIIHAAAVLNRLRLAHIQKDAA